MHPAAGALDTGGFINAHSQLRIVAALTYQCAFGSVLPVAGGYDTDFS